MVPVIIQVGIWVGGAIVGYKLLTSEKEEVLKASDCSDLLFLFDRKIKIPEWKKTKLREAKNHLCKKIKDYFNALPGYTLKGVFIQGSYKLDTIIHTSDGNCDVDVGIYFSKVPAVTTATVKNHVWKALNGPTANTPENWSKVIRKQYADFHVDFPLYLQKPNSEYPLLATKKESWRLEAPRHFFRWFMTKAKGEELEQLKLIIRLIKYWSSRINHRTPHGLAFTIMIADNFQEKIKDKRIDVALVKALSVIQNNLEYNEGVCKMPVEPHDNVLRKLTSYQIKRFRVYLREFIEDGKRALTTESQTHANEVWIKYFGNKFPKVDG